MTTPVIFGCASYILNHEERAFFKKHKPLGLILFERNCDTPAQVKNLVSSFRECVGHKDAPVLIDQEGGRVVRLKPPHWSALPPANSFKNTEEGRALLFEQSIKIAHELLDIGITVNCAPCCDLLFEGANEIIGDRSYSNNTTDAIDLCSAVIEGFLEAGLTPTIKHLPGHGRACVDSHKALPIIDDPREELEQTDFTVFKALCEKFDTSKIWGMTAHAIYSAFDAKNCATQSNIIIENIIRDYFSFKGPIISDCLTMKALKGSYAKRAELTLNAGCDIALHCSGKMDEMLGVIKGINSALANKSQLDIA